MDVTSLGGTPAAGPMPAQQPAGGTASADPAVPPPDFGPAAVFTPSEQLLNLKSQQDAAIVSGFTADTSADSKLSDNTYALASRYQIYDNSGSTVPLPQ